MGCPESMVIAWLTDGGTRQAQIDPDGEELGLNGAFREGNRRAIKGNNE